jgi:HSP20 family molecular chaperone IbpA
MSILILKPEITNPEWFTSEDFSKSPTEGRSWRTNSRHLAWRPLTDVFETEDALVIRVEIAGMRESDFSISVVNRSLIIRGNRPDIAERRAYHQMEIPFGDFNSEIQIPFPVAVDEIEAVYRDGFLRVTLPKAKPQQIRVK